MSKGNKCAVLLAAYNGEKYLKTQIDSILNQDEKSIDIYISLDLSDDDSLSLCRKYVEAHERVHLLEYGKRYGSASANFFRLITDVKLEEYSYIALADQDDFWFPWKVSRGISLIDNNNLDAYSSNAIAYWENDKVKGIVKSQLQTEFDYIFESAGHGCTYIFKSESLLKFKEQLITKSDISSKISQHDWLIYFYFRSMKLCWHIDSDFSMLYRQHSNNDFGVNEGLSSYLTRIKKVRNGWYKEQVLLNCSFVEWSPDIIKSKILKIINFRKLRRRNRDKLAILVFILIGGI